MPSPSVPMSYFSRISGTTPTTADRLCNFTLTEAKQFRIEAVGDFVRIVNVRRQRNGFRETVVAPEARKVLDRIASHQPDFGRLVHHLWKSKVANPLEQFYFGRYCWLTLTADGPTLPHAARVKEYPVVFSGDFLASSAMIAVPPGPITIRKVKLTPEAMRHLLQINIYGGYTFWGTLRYPLAGFFFCFFPLMFLGVRLDRKRNAAA